MTTHPRQHESQQWEHESGLHDVLTEIRSSAPSKESMQRFVTKAANLDFPTTKPGAHNNSSVRVDNRRELLSVVLNKRLRMTFTLAVSVLIAASVTFLLLSRQSAWAQVIDSVAQRSWVRLTLQPPTKSSLDENLPFAAIWFSGDCSIAAIKSSQQNAWLNLTDGDQFEISAEGDQIFVSKMNHFESRQIDYFFESLAPFSLNYDGENIPLAEEKSATEVTVDGVEFLDFTFEVQSPSDPKAVDIVAVRVTKDTLTPAELRTHGAVFAIDYPEFGPTDVYALGIADETPIIDLRNMEQFFHGRVPGNFDNYEAIEIMTLAGMEGRWINEARRYRSTNGVNEASHAELEQVLALANSVYFAGTDVPTGTSRTPEWWTQEVKKLEFTSQEWSDYNFPHLRCYSPIGSVRNYITFQNSNLEGLEGTIELRGKQLTVWLDPRRDFIVRRIENAMDDGTFSVTQYDSVVQDSKGHWFVTQWRNGRVEEHGGALPMKVDRENSNLVATAVYTVIVDFKQ